MEMFFSNLGKKQILEPIAILGGNNKTWGFFVTKLMKIAFGLETICKAAL